jgi:predicted ATP-grasp superfamily ATP-dependent carboligase
MTDATPSGDRRTTHSVLVYEYVTGGGLAPGSRTAELAAKGHAMRRALVHDLAAVPGVEVRMLLDAPYADEPGPWTTIRVAPGGPGRDREPLEREAANADFTIVIAPEAEGLLAERAGWVQAIDPTKLLGPGQQAVELAGHKARLAEHLAAAGVCVPPGQRIDTTDDHLPADDEFPYPAVLKPVQGAGAYATFFIDDPARPPAGALDERPALLQAYVPGTPMSASFLVGRDGRAELVAVGRQRIAIESGRFRYRGGVVPAGHPDMADEPRRAVEAVPGLCGWIGVEFIWNEASAAAVVIEINPRLTMSFTGLSRRLPPGSLAHAWLAACTPPGTFDPLPPGPSLAERLAHAGKPVTFDLRGRVRADDEGDNDCETHLS